MSGKLVGALLVAGLIALPRVALAGPGSAIPTPESAKATRDACVSRSDSTEQDQKLRTQLAQQLVREPAEKATRSGEVVRQDEPARKSAITRRSADRNGDARLKAEHLALLAERLKQGKRGLAPEFARMTGDDREQQFRERREDHDRQNGQTQDDREKRKERDRDNKADALDERSAERRFDKRDDRRESRDETKVAELKDEKEAAKKEAKEDAKQERLAELKDQKADAKKEVADDRIKERRDERQREETDSRRTGTTTTTTTK